MSIFELSHEKHAKEMSYVESHSFVNSGPAACFVSFPRQPFQHESFLQCRDSSH